MPKVEATKVARLVKHDYPALFPQAESTLVKDLRKHFKMAVAREDPPPPAAAPVAPARAQITHTMTVTESSARPTFTLPPGTYFIGDDKLMSKNDLSMRNYSEMVPTLYTIQEQPTGEKWQMIKFPCMDEGSFYNVDNDLHFYDCHATNVAFTSIIPADKASQFDGFDAEGGRIVTFSGSVRCSYPRKNPRSDILISDGSTNVLLMSVQSYEGEEYTIHPDRLFSDESYMTTLNPTMGDILDTPFYLFRGVYKALSIAKYDEDSGEMYRIFGGNIRIDGNKYKACALFHDGTVKCYETHPVNAEFEVEPAATYRAGLIRK
jgi:hypothetical protein